MKKYADADDIVILEESYQEVIYIVEKLDYI